MVAVLMGEEHRVDPRERFPHLIEQLAEPAGGKPGVDEHARTLGHEQRGVARASAAENGEAHRHGELMVGAGSRGPDKKPRTSEGPRD